MTWIAPDSPRKPAPLAGDERILLRGWLDFHRATLLAKCAGLDTEQLRRRSVAPSTMSLLGLVRHMTEVERGWFRLAAAGLEVDYVYCSEENPNGDFDDAHTADAPPTFAAYHAEIADADDAVAPLPLDHVFQWNGTERSVRWVYLHMIEEYARHNGHADLLRERIDGAVGS